MKNTLSKIIVSLLIVASISVAAFGLYIAFKAPYVEAAYSPVIATSPHWVKITKSYTDFSTAGLTNTVALTTLPAKSVVHSTLINPTTTFVGGLISAYAISVDMVSAGDLFFSASLFTLPTRPLPTNRAILAGTVGSTQAVTVTATSVTGNLDAATQGSVDIYLLVSTLP